MHLGTKIVMSPKKGVEQSLPETEMGKEVELTAGLEFELSLRKGVEPRLTKIEKGDDAQIAVIQVVKVIQTTPKDSTEYETEDKLNNENEESRMNLHDEEN